MATGKAELFTADSVMSYYENSPCTRFTVYYGTRIDPLMIRYPFEEDNKPEGRSKLQEALDSILQNPDNDSVYLLVLIADRRGKAGVTSDYQRP